MQISTTRLTATGSITALVTAGPTRPLRRYVYGSSNPRLRPLVPQGE